MLLPVICHASSDGGGLCDKPVLTCDTVVSIGLSKTILVVMETGASTLEGTRNPVQVVKADANRIEKTITIAIQLLSVQLFLYRKHSKKITLKNRGLIQVHTEGFCSCSFRGACIWGEGLRIGMKNVSE